MLGSEYNWLIRHTRAAGRIRVQLVGSTLFTLAIVAFCVTGTALTPMSHPAPPQCAVAANTCKRAIKAMPPGDWPRKLVLVWFLLPHLVPNDN